MVGSDKYQYLTYPIPNSELVRLLRLQKHPEGGYYAETDRQEEQVPSPFANGAPRPLATTIYYLLTVDDPQGVFHLNKSPTMHVHHQGRAEYTLITPGNPPRVEKKIVGPNIHAGESLQLLVGSNVWKRSQLLSEDVEAAKKDPSKQQFTGCLITEVVFPGFHWEDHAFLTESGLKAFWNHRLGWEEHLPFVKSC